MRVLIIPEIYKSQEASANSTVYNVAKWVEDWVDRDDSLHAHILMPPKSDTNWDDDYMNAGHDRVTVLTAKRLEDDDRFYGTEGWSEDALDTLRREIETYNVYWDAVIDQRAYARSTIWMFMNEAFQSQKATVKPFDLIDFCHDIASPYKVHGKRYRNNFAPLDEYSNLLKADQVWFKAPMDRKEYRQFATEWYQYSAVDEVIEKSITTNSQIDFDNLDHEYRDEPKYLHVAGDIAYTKKNSDTLFEVAEALYRRHGIETIITSMKDVKPEYKELSCVTEVKTPATYQEYLDALSKGDIVVSASREDEVPTTFFEQAASGQVFLAWDKEWIYDQIPEDYKLTIGAKTKLPKLALWAVANWDEAVAENKRMVEYMKDLRSIDEVGQKTYSDLERLLNERLSEIDPSDWQIDAIESAFDYVSDDPVAISDLDEATRHFTDSGKPMTEMYHYAYTDMVLAIRSLGYKDVGTREPQFTEQ